MILICPSCGATHSIEAWESNAQARQCLKIVGELPQGISRRCFAYIAMFRNPSRALRWEKVLTLLSELQQLITGPNVHWKNQPARPNSTDIWGAAIDQMVANPPSKLPLKTHGYLTSIAYDIANEHDKKREAEIHRLEKSGSLRNKFDAQNTGLQPFTVDPDFIKNLRKNKKI